MFPQVGLLNLSKMKIVVKLFSIILILKPQAGQLNELENTMTEIQNTVINVSRTVLEMSSRSTSCFSNVNKSSLTTFDENIGNIDEEVLSKKDYTNLDCSHLYLKGKTASGVYSIWLMGAYKKIYVYCDMETNSTHTNKMGWITIQKRVNGEVNFDRNWDDYVRGFGDLNGDYWLGLENIYQLTFKQMNTMRYGFVNVPPVTLRLNFEDWDGVKAYFEYTDFYIGDSTENYELFGLGQNRGTAAGSYTYGIAPIFKEPFSTYDNEQTPYNCATNRKCGWWYFSCDGSNLNLPYAYRKQKMTINTIYWKYWKYVNEQNTALRYVSMAIQY